MITSSFTCTCAELLTYHLLQCEYDLMRIESLHIAFMVAGWNHHSLVFVSLKFFFLLVGFFLLWWCCCGMAVLVWRWNHCGTFSQPMHLPSPYKS